MRRSVVFVLILGLCWVPMSSASAERQWGDPDSASIRPGMRIAMEEGTECTANFVFTDSEGDVYLGTAAHCVDRIGQKVWRTEGSWYTGSEYLFPFGEVAYSGFLSQGVDSSPCYVVLSCSDPAWDDFALIRINSEAHQAVHPAMLHFGGPTGLIPFEEVEVGDRILTQGASSMRPGPSRLGAREGYVVDKDSTTNRVYVWAVPGIFGDSGSGVMLADGRALGTLVTLEFERGMQNGIVSLSASLELARQRGMDVSLATWDLLDPGHLPNLR